MGCFYTFFNGIFRLLKAVLIFFGLLVVIGLFIGNSDNEKATVENTATPTAAISTIAPTSTPTAAPTPTATVTQTPTAFPSPTPTKEPVEILLKYPELGQYGMHYTFNENVEKAEEADKETIIQCFVPAGSYTITNQGKHPTFVYIYSKETVFSDSGWEEPADGWVSKMLQVGDSCEINIPEGHYINLQQNDVFLLVQ